MSAPDLVSRAKAAEEDEQLLERIAGMDPTAIRELYDRYGRTLFGVLYRMLGDPEAAEEVAQDAFHAVWRQARTYRNDRGSVRTWLLAIGRNAAIDWRRTKGRRIERETVIEQAAEIVIESRVEDRVIAGLQAARVRAAVETLPDEQRTAVSLSFWGGLSQSEIAERTGTPLGTVKSRVRLGMAKLRDRLAAEATE